ncbi:MAG: HEAT repeat domain-containing protein [Candidatus Wallbacteria bacterium]|nr:HEAT repeat domain-containing protein [Candidatus Wallbacteria bacterium]
MPEKNFELILQHGAVEEKRAALEELTKIKSGASLSLLYQAANEGGLDIRYSAWSALRKLRDSICSSFLDLPEQEQHEIVNLFEKHKDRDVVPFLCEIIYCVPYKVLVYVVQSLGIIGDRRALSHLHELCHKPELHPFVKSALVKALGRLGDQDEIPILQGMLNSGDNRLKANTIEALEFIGDKKIIPLILPFLHDPDDRVRAYAAKALWKLGDDSMLGSFKDLLKVPQTEIRESVVFALGEALDPRVIPLLAEQLDCQDTKLQDSTINAISKIARWHPNRETFLNMGQAYGSTSPYVRAMFLDKLVEIGEYLVRRELSPSGAAMLSPLAESLARDRPDHAVTFQELVFQKDGTEASLKSLLHYYKRSGDFQSPFRKVYSLFREFPKRYGYSELFGECVTPAESLLPYLPELWLAAAGIMGPEEFTGFSSNFFKELEVQLELLHSAAELYILENSKLDRNELFLRQNSILERVDQNLADTHLQLLKKLLVDGEFSGPLAKLNHVHFLHLMQLAAQSGKQQADLCKETACKAVILLLTLKLLPAESREYWCQRYVNIMPKLPEGQIPLKPPVAEYLAQRFIACGSYDSALSIYQKILEEQPSDLLIHRELALIHEMLGNLDNAASEYEIVEELASSQGQPYIQFLAIRKLITISPEREKYISKLSELESPYCEKYKNLLRNDPDNYTVLSLLYEANLLLYRFQEAFLGLSSLQRFIPEQKFRRGMIMEFIAKTRGYDNKTALQAFLILLSREFENSDLEEFHLLLQEIKKDLPQETALSELDRVEVFPLETRARLLILINYGDTGGIFELISRLYLKEHEKVREIMEFFVRFKAIENSTARAAILTILGEYYERTRKIEQNQELFDEINKLEPGDTMILEKIAEINLHLGKNSQALNYYKKLTAREPDNPSYLQKIGDILQSSGNQDEAFEAFQSALKIDSTLQKEMKKCLEIIGDELCEGQIDKAYTKCMFFSEIAAKSSMAAEFSELQELIVDQHEIMKKVETLIETHEPGKILEQLQALLESSRENTFSVIWGLKKLLQMNPPNQDLIKFQLGDCYSNLKEYGKAMNWYARTEQAMGNDARAMMAYCAIRLEREDEAFHLLNRIPKEAVRESNLLVDEYKELIRIYEKKNPGRAQMIKDLLSEIFPGYGAEK